MKQYEILHDETLVCSITDTGQCMLLRVDLMPYQLYLEEADDVDTRVNNMTNFYYWCATRVLTLDRQYVKQILNSIGATQAMTDRDRAMIALSYHCLSLTDVFWVREAGEPMDYASINLYENHLSNAFVDIALRGRQMTVNNAHLVADDISTQGQFPKAWLREEDGFYLLKDGGEDLVRRELLASRICQCFECHQVLYEPFIWEGTSVSKSRLMTDRRYSIVTREAFEIYAVNHDIDVEKYVLDLDAYSYYMMNLLDYLVGNTDRHWGNWGFLVDNETNQPIRLYDLMDFNQTFMEYDTLTGASCQTVFHGQSLTQQEAALAAVRAVGWNQQKEIEKGWFAGNEKEYEMLCQRMLFLKENR